MKVICLASDVKEWAQPGSMFVPGCRKMVKALFRQPTFEWQLAITLIFVLTTVTTSDLTMVC